MRHIAVTRHPGALVWLAESGFKPDLVVEHLDTDLVIAGDIVVGSLPVQMIAVLTKRGAHYGQIAFAAERGDRGVELSADTLRARGARIEWFRASAIGPPK